MKSNTKPEYSDTTVKLDSSVVREIRGILEEKQTLTSFVREAVERDVRRRKMQKAATLYRDALLQDSAEAKDMEAWESASLASIPQNRKCP